MLIRSQDKRTIVNLNNVDCIYSQEITKATKHTYYILYNSIWLGEYNSDEEAIKVLDDICQAYELERYTSNYYCNGVDSFPCIYNNNVVFNMPKKEGKDNDE